MSDLGNLFSTLIHLSIDKLGLSVTTRAVLLPHVPTIVNTIKNVTFTGELPNISITYKNIESIVYSIISVLLLIISIGGFMWKTYYYNKSNSNDESEKKEVKPDTINITISNYADIMGFLFYVHKNSVDNTVIRSLKTNNLQLKPFYWN